MEILHWSGRLPVLMSWLATPQGEEADPSLPLHDIVERFLRWVTEPTWREIALLVAFPHTFNLDMLHVLLPQGKYSMDEQAAFAWLQSMPFVQSRTEGWQYHPVVRHMMLRYQRQTSPQRYARIQTILAEWYETRCHRQQEETEAKWTNEQWRKDILEYIYHYLAADPLAHWEKSIEWFVLAMRKRRMFAGEIVDMFHRDEVQDELRLEQSKVVQLLYEQFQMVKEGSLQDGRAMFEYICTMEHLSAVAKGYVFAFRGESYGQTGRYEEALADFERAIALDEKDSWTIARRGEIYRLMGRYDKALADFDRAHVMRNEVV
jgi:tetratricopeptide (TPR) repeat protein